MIVRILSFLILIYSVAICDVGSNLAIDVAVMRLDMYMYMHFLLYCTVCYCTVISITGMN